MPVTRSHPRRQRHPSPGSTAAIVWALLAVMGLVPACGDGARGPASGPEILILGSEHLAQQDQRTPDAEVAAVVDSLRPYAPDLVVVEYLPADWPVGEGRDYRWTFDDSSYAERWAVPLDSAAPRLAALRDTLGDTRYGDLPETRRCQLARLHFLARDRANALYYWLDADCTEESDSLLTEWIDHRGEHEMARIAFPLARASGLRGVVSFDYQGDDARWFLGPGLYDEVRAEGTPADVRAVDSLLTAMERFRARVDSGEAGSFMGSLRHKNSRRWIAMQRSMYEDIFPILTYDDSAGRRQTGNYWLRNRRMFDGIDAAVEARDPERVLVVVGAGHKYFLDELAEDRGYRWVDPLDYLGPGR